MPSIHINLGYFVELGALPFPLAMVRLFLDGGWVVFLIILLMALWALWVDSRQQKFAAGVRYTTLAIDVPRDNLQTPKAVEHIFSQLSGAYSGLDNIEKYWEGKFQLSMSFEIVSIGGYVQFIVHTPVKYRDLVEAAFYAQYSSAEISEINDYTDKVPTQYPDPEWDMFGTEFVLKGPNYVPLRTWEQFEHKSAEDMFKDPLSGVLETLSALRPGEQMWFQIIITPTDQSWKKKGDEAANKMLGKKVAPKKGFIEHVLELPLGLLNEAAVQIAGVDFADSGSSDAKSDAPRMLALSPGERNVLEAIQTKLTKYGFLTTMRMVYAGKRDVFNKGRVTAMKGAMSQFGSLDMNQIKGYGPVVPKSDYFHQRWSVNAKKANLVRNYRNRSNAGATPFILNTEELATLFHFPMTDIKAPLVSKTDAKRGEPPARLPTEEYLAERPFSRMAKPEPSPEPSDDEEEKGAPKNLPFA